MMAGGTFVALAVAWIASGVFATWIGNRTLRRQYPLASTDSDGVFYVLSLLGPANLIGMLWAIKPWRN